MQLFYTPDLTDNSPIYYLNEEESKHCIRVLRLKKGDKVQLIDGKGGLYEAEIVEEHPKKVALNLLSQQQEFGKRNHYLHIAIAPTKNIERLEWFLEKATEIGIDEISLIICQRSERKEAKAERLNKIITAAIKQSLKAYHPVLNEPMPLSKLITKPFSGQKFMAHCEPGEKFDLKSKVEPNGRYLILIGPEGDFSPKEIEDALQNGFEPITLGNSRLRIETAGLEACFEINYINR
jgi:16S rRNA (uracil1498-N3)-methyltransferase